MRLAICSFLMFNCILLVTPQEVDSPKYHLDEGLKAYNNADFEQTISEIEKALQLGLREKQDLIKAHLHLGFAYIGLGRRIDAVVEFAKAINLEPSLKLDPKLYSSKIISTFNETKEGLVDSLTVISSPGGADLFLDGQKVGATPIKLTDVLVGEHTLTLSKELFQTKELRIRVEKGEDNRVQVQLEKAEVRIIIDSLPSEANIYLSDQPIGKTPFPVRCYLDQTLAFKLTKEGFNDLNANISITETGAFVKELNKYFPFKEGVSKLVLQMSSAPAPGSILISSEPPQADVYIDGVAVGITPIELKNVTPGERVVRVSIPNFDSSSRIVQVKSNERIELNVLLGGQLKILTFPENVEVFIDGKLAGATPLTTTRLSVGDHQVKLSRTGYSDKAINITLNSGDLKEINTRLIALKGSLYISSEPQGAQIYLNGELKGSTPKLIYGITAGKHSLILKKEGFKDFETELIMKGHELKWLYTKLKYSD